MKNTKKILVNLGATALALAVCGSVTLGVLVPSYNDWKNYYDQVMEDREQQKYLNSLPLEYIGLDAKLRDGVEYYDNGKARPKNDDFEVTAHFTEKGKAFDEILLGNSFELDVPEGFAEHGGTVTVSYAFTPETAEGEEPAEPVVKTAEVNCTLTDVVPVSIARKDLPYRVYYSDEMSFDFEGMTATVSFNDGSTEEVENFIASADHLAAGDETATVTWERGGTTLDLSVPVTVVSAAEYDDGEILQITSAEKIYVPTGQDISELKPNIRATYESGNRLLLQPSQYRLEATTSQASLSKTCVVSVFLKSNASLFTRFVGIVENGIEAEAATLAGVSGSTVTDGWTYDENDELVQEEELGVVQPVTGSSITFTVEVDDFVKPDFYLRLAVLGGSHSLDDIASLTVNDKPVSLPHAELRAPEAGKKVFEKVKLPSVLLKSGSNTLKLTFKEGANDIAIDRISLESSYKGEFYVSTEDYLVQHAESQGGTDFRSDVFLNATNWKSASMYYASGICSDGSNLYLLVHTWGNGTLRPFCVVKYDLLTKTQVAISENTAQNGREECAGVTYYDGKIIIYQQDGSCLYVNASEFTDNVVFQPYDGFHFEGLEGQRLDDVYYNTARSTFAVSSGNMIRLYDKNQKQIENGQIAYKVPTGYKGTIRMTGTLDYIYISYSKDGVHQPYVDVYDWDGAHIGQLTVPLSSEAVTECGLTYKETGGSYNVQGLAVINGDFYAVLCAWGPACGAILRVTMPPIAEELELDFTADEYFTYAESESETPAFTVSPVYGEQGAIPGQPYMASGSVYQDGYLYIATTAGALSCIDSKAQVVKNNSKSGSDVSSRGRLFIKDDILYFVYGSRTETKLYSLPLEDYSATAQFNEETALATLLQGGDAERVVWDVKWSETQQKYVVLASKSGSWEVYTVDGKGQATIISSSAQIFGYDPSSVLVIGDHILVSHRADGQASLPIDVYEFSGTKKWSIAVDFSAAKTAIGDKYNVQSLYVAEGKLCAVMCGWQPSNGFDWALTPSLSL